MLLDYSVFSPFLAIFATARDNFIRDISDGCDSLKFLRKDSYVTTIYTSNFCEFCLFREIADYMELGLVTRFVL